MDDTTGWAKLRHGGLGGIDALNDLDPSSIEHRDALVRMLSVYGSDEEVLSILKQRKENLGYDWTITMEDVQALRTAPPKPRGPLFMFMIPCAEPPTSAS